MIESYNLFTRRMQSLGIYRNLLRPVSGHVINRVSKERKLLQLRMIAELHKNRDILHYLLLMLILVLDCYQYFNYNPKM